jgi:hypothetical protein
MGSKASRFNRAVDFNRFKPGFKTMHSTIN